MIFTSSMGDEPAIPKQNAIKTLLESPYLLEPSVQDKKVFVDAVSGQGYTIAQFRKLVPRAAALFKNEFGVGRGDIIGLFGVNHIFTPVVHFATLTLAAIVSPANIMYSAEELAHQLRQTKPRLLIVLDPAKPVAEKAADLAKSTETKIVTFSELFAKLAALITSSNAAEEHPVDVDPWKETAYLCFSSGTSGLPKGVVTTHTNILGNILQIMKTQTPPTNPAVCQSALLPMSHIFGLNVELWGGAYAAKTTVVFPKFDLDFFVAKVVEYKLELLYLVPPIVLLLGKSQVLDKYPEFGNVVKYIVSGAAPLSKETMQLVLNRAPKIQFAQGYGLTETSPIVTQGFHTDPKIQATYHQESIGWLQPGVEARLVDPETGKDVTGRNQRGELWVRGLMVMAEYYKNEKATAESITKDRWFKTGDVATVDDSDQFYIVDRIKELIKSNGHQVAPAELESILLTNDGVLDAAVIGVMNENKTSENPRAYLVLQKGIDVTDVINWFNKQVAKHKRLWGGVVVVAEIPKSATGKILRKELRLRKGDKAVGMELLANAKL